MKYGQRETELAFQVEPEIIKRHLMIWLYTNDVKSVIDCIFIRLELNADMYIRKLHTYQPKRS